MHFMLVLRDAGATAQTSEDSVSQQHRLDKRNRCSKHAEHVLLALKLS